MSTPMDDNASSDLHPIERDPERFSAANDPGELRPDKGYTEMLAITCKNHPDAYYLMKNIRGRSLHFIRPSEKWCEEALARIEADPSLKGTLGYECDCPTRDLIFTDDGPLKDAPVWPNSTKGA